MTLPNDTTTQTNITIKPSPKKIVTPTKKNNNQLSTADSIFFGLKDSDSSPLVVKLNINDNSITPITTYSTDSSAVTTTTQHTPLHNSKRGETVLNADSLWLLAITTITLIVCGVIKIRNPHFLPSLISSIVSEQNFKRINTSQSLSNLLPTFLCKGIFYISITTVIYESIIATDFLPTYNIRGIALYGSILAIIFLLTGTKYIVNKIISFTFAIPSIVTQLNSNETISQCLAGITLIPFALLFPFANESHYPIFIYASITIIIGIYIWRLLKSLKIVLNFYVFLYLCTVEIAPLLCIYKTALLLTN